MPRDHDSTCRSVLALDPHNVVVAERDASYFFQRFESAYREGDDLLAAQGRLMRSIADAIAEQGAVPVPMEHTFRRLRDAWATDDPDTQVLRSSRRRTETR